MTAISSRAGRKILWLVLAFIIAAGILTAVRAHKGSNDFDTFYEAGRAVLEGRGIYYTGEYYEENFERGPFLYPPAAALFFAVFAWMPLPLAAFAWSALNVLLFASCLSLILRAFGVSAEKAWITWKESTAFDRVAAAILAGALFLDNLSMAQMNILIFWLCLTGIRMEREFKRSLLAGMIFALAAAFKLTPALFFFYYFAKGRGRVLAGMLAGAAVFTLLVPTLVFGPNQNRIYHQQWAGKMLKPRMIPLLEHFRPEIPDPRKPSYEKLSNQALTDLLTPQNQSLEAGLHRLFLRDRNDTARNPSFPVYAAQDYEKLPVLFGGLPRDSLQQTAKILQLFMLLFMIVLWMRGRENPCRDPLGITLVFLAMTLFSPSARSHQAVVWLWPAAILLLHHFYRGTVFNGLWKAGILLYAAQVLPYGKAAAMGMWANLVFWGLFAGLLIKESLPRKFIPPA